MTVLYGMTTMCSTFASSVFSPAIGYVARDYGISQEVSILGISLFVLGYIPGKPMDRKQKRVHHEKLKLLLLGPILFAPLSELYGRKISIVVPIFIFACFSAG